MRFGASVDRRIRGLTAAALCFAAFGLAACGGDDDSTDSAQPTASQAADIKAIDQIGVNLEEAVKAEDPAGLCDRIEPASLKQQFQTRNRCIKLLKTQFATMDQKPSFKLTAITVDGDTATAEQEDENLGPVTFVKLNGKWYIDLFPEPVPSGSDSSEG